MKNWTDEFICQILADIPAGRYRTRAEKELRDHMETQCQALVEAGESPRDAHLAVWNTMGDPETLRAEYLSAWRRSMQGRLEALGLCLRTWAKGLAVMAGVHFLVSYTLGCMWRAAISLPANSFDPQIRMIRNTLGNLNNTYLRLWLPLVLALTAGAVYLGRRFRTSRWPTLLISAALSFHWAYMAAFDIWWEAIDDHRTFGEEFVGYVTHNAVYFSLTFAVCILLGVVFGWKRERRLA